MTTDYHTPVIIVTGSADRASLPPRLRGEGGEGLAGDHELVDLRRALVDAQRAHLAVQALDGLGDGDAEAAPQRDRAVDHALRGFRRVHLGHRGLARDPRRALVLRPRGAVSHAR